MHRTLSPEQMNSGRVIIVGDVHGCNKELHELLVHVNFQTGIDNLILAGDLVNKGPDSLGVSAIIAFPSQLDDYCVKAHLLHLTR